MSVMMELNDQASGVWPSNIALDFILVKMLVWKIYALNVSLSLLIDCWSEIRFRVF